MLTLMRHRLPSVSCVLALAFGISSCQQQQTTDKRAPENRLPTAAEVFELRSKCAALGEKIMEENIIGIALTQDQISRYSPETNRCYVKLEVSTADLTTPQENFIRHEYLYDGQTKEMLAFASWEGNKKWGMIYSDSLKKFAHDPASPTYEEADALIDKFIAEDRKP